MILNQDAYISPILVFGLSKFNIFPTFLFLISFSPVKAGDAMTRAVPRELTFIYLR
jgi:hypothetical protein